MSEKLFSEINDTTKEQYFFLYRLSRSTNTMYNFIIVVVILICCSLPYIEIDVTSLSLGSIQSKQLKEIVFSPATGKIDMLYIQNNESILKGGHSIFY